MTTIPTGTEAPRLLAESLCRRLIIIAGSKRAANTKRYAGAGSLSIRCAV